MNPNPSRSERLLHCGVLALALLATALPVACKSRSRLPRTMPVTKEMRVQAQQATELSKWDVAAQRWYSIFVDSGGKDREACAETARAMMHLNDPESALRVLQQGVESNPDAGDLYELQGDALVQQNFRRAAERCYVKATELDPKRASVWRALGRVRVELGYEGAAVNALQKAIDLGRDDFATWILLARAQVASGNPCGAFQAYVQAFQRGDGDPELYVDASTLYLDEIVRRAHKDAADCAQAWLERAIERHPDFTQAYFELGVLKEELGKKDEAVEHYRTAISKDPTFLPALRNLALLYFERKDPKNTREMVQRALKLEKDPECRKALENLLEPMTQQDSLPQAPAPETTAREGQPL
ncbi:MAG: tetratricopeptide repeat protein [Planctomycetes bacterium]|nr:tetratricopeptide repeat protein [Planctomycetota bacterium]